MTSIFKRSICIILSALLCLSSCMHAKTEFSISDFVENSISCSMQDVFSRYGFDLENAVQIETTDSSEVVLETIETVDVGEKVPIQFSFADDKCIMMKYRIILSSEDMITSAYEVLMQQSELLRTQLIQLCNFENMDEHYTTFPDDRFKSVSDLKELSKGKEVYNTGWTWILNQYDESENTYADLALWLPENNVDGYVEFRIYKMNRGLMGSK